MQCSSHLLKSEDTLSIMVLTQVNLNFQQVYQHTPKKHIRF